MLKEVKEVEERQEKEPDSRRLWRKVHNCQRSSVESKLSGVFWVHHPAAR